MITFWETTSLRGVQVHAYRDGAKFICGAKNGPWSDNTQPQDRLEKKFGYYGCEKCKAKLARQADA